MRKLAIALAGLLLTASLAGLSSVGLLFTQTANATTCPPENAVCTTEAFAGSLGSGASNILEAGAAGAIAGDPTRLVPDPTSSGRIMNPPGVSGDSDRWEGWGYEYIAEVSG